MSDKCGNCDCADKSQCVYVFLNSTTRSILLLINYTYAWLLFLLHRNFRVYTNPIDLFSLILVFPDKADLEFIYMYINLLCTYTIYIYIYIYIHKQTDLCTYKSLKLNSQIHVISILLGREFPFN
jgi:hypothetical protein